MIGCHIGDDDKWMDGDMRKKYEITDEFIPTQEEYADRPDYANYPGQYTAWEEEMISQEKETATTMAELQKILQGSMSQPKATSKVKKMSFDDVAQKQDMNNFEKYMPGPEFFKPAMGRLMQYMSEDDCKAILDHLFKELSKDDRELHISPRIETTIISMMVDRA
jgi:hypothetical protein